jgi:hypothetical protein
VDGRRGFMLRVCGKVQLPGDWPGVGGRRRRDDHVRPHSRDSCLQDRKLQVQGSDPGCDVAGHDDGGHHSGDDGGGDDGGGVDENAERGLLASQYNCFASDVM